VSAAFPNVLVPVWLDTRDDTVLEVVRSLGAAGDVERVVLLHVAETGRAWVGRAPPPPPRPAALDLLVADLDAALASVEVVGRFVNGRGIDEIARVAGAEAADLLVVGRAAAPPPGAGWAEHGQRILRLADTSVLVVPEGAAATLRSAVVGMDFSESAVHALKLAVRLCERVRACAVVDRFTEGGGEDLHAVTRAAWAEVLGEGPRPELVVVDAASPADALLGMGDADLLVVGSRGLTPLAAVLLGSTAERLGAACVSPLLVVRRKGEHQGLFSTLFRS
jgi:nucleotide-binding universal stress UspA family protein